ncbi:MAG TPA: ubiquinol-cytochrome c reductase iron-sulfur subunit [Acidimicrobiales bacterium]|nr:ubiquinol-cytochrome c reductase iron-sulfur subunit [Acidimicrobiales bacterium]
MSSGAILAIAIGIVVVLAIVLLATTSARRDRQAAVGVLSRETRQRDRSAAGLEAVAPEGVAPVTGKDVEKAAALERTGGAVAIPARAAPPAVTGPVDPETYGQTRRQFLNRSIVGLMVVSLSGFGATLIAFLWPSVSAGFGAKITAGTVSDVEKTLATKQPFYNPVGRFYINPYPTDAGTLAKAKKVYSPALLVGLQAGYVALYQRCVHLGCRVPWCVSSQWFECPCHGSKYNRVGEKKGGPAPRGLDRFALSVSGGSITVDTGTIYVGPPIGTNTTGQGQDGPHCA